jgi:TolB protein
MVIGQSLSADEPLPRLTVATTRYGAVNLITVDIHGKNAVQVTNETTVVSEPAWSPDGKLLAYTARPSGTGQIFVMNADGTGAHKLTNNFSAERNPTWSPDGKKIAFTCDRSGNADIWAVDVDGSKLMQLTNQPTVDCDPCWSPDGKQIAFTSERISFHRLYVMDADGSNVVDLSLRDELAVMYPTWSPDSKQIAFGGRSTTDTLELCIINTDGQGRRDLTRGGRSHSFAAWSPDGQYIAYVAFTPGNDAVGADLLIYDLAADTHTQILTGELSMVMPRPSWQPDQKLSEKPAE